MTDTELELPKGWVKQAFDLCISNIIGGDWGNPVKEEIDNDFVKVQVLRSTELKNWKTEKGSTAESRIIKKSSLEKRQLHNGDIILEVSGGGTKFPVGRSVLIKTSITDNFSVPIICSNFFRKITLSEFLDPMYASNFLDYYYYSGETIKFKNQSVNIQNLKTKEYLSALSITIPPLNEQKRIVSKIEELFSKIDSTKQSLEETKLQLELYRQSLFKFLFNRTTNFVTLEECAKIGSGGTPSRQKPEYYGGDIPWVKTTEVQNSYIQSTSEKITDLGLKNSSAKIYPKNSVILAMYGEGKTRGKCAILNINASTNQACAVITCNNKKLLFKFCFYWFQSQYDQMRLKSSGGNQPNLNLGIIKKTKIPLPSLEEQEQIVSLVEQGFSLIQNTTQIVNSTLQKLQTMKMSILKQAFEGKLVPQDPKDEPDSVLLEKIKAK